MFRFSRLLSFTLILCCCGEIWAQEAAPATEQRQRRTPENPDFDRWESKIQEFETWDSRRLPPKNHILFAGASSIVMWKLNDWYPEWRPINRGFGGSFMAETTHFADRTILKHEPKVVVLYSGENDIARGSSPETLLEEFKKFVKTIHDPLPETTIVFLAIKPTEVRWRVIEEIRESNALIKEYCEANDHLEFIDTHTPILGEDGRPRKELFQDAVHLNEDGYALWDAELRPVLERVFQPETKAEGGD